jgi:hypothetical protein
MVIHSCTRRNTPFRNAGVIFRAVAIHLMVIGNSW